MASKNTQAEEFKLFDLEALSLIAMIKHFIEFHHVNDEDKNKLREGYNKIHELPRDDISAELWDSLNANYTDYLNLSKSD